MGMVRRWFTGSLLAALNDWTDPTKLSATPELNEVIQELADHGLLEVGK